MFMFVMTNAETLMKHFRNESEKRLRVKSIPDFTFS